MAQWSHADRTLYAKLVYYGPAFGGKTTNLQALHRITDPDRRTELLTISTADDRTLFFDLLPFELGDIQGYRVALKLYTVPGQVRYETTRQVVLAGADAVVFVADSSRSRQEQNAWSLQNLRMNMRAKGLDADRVPVLFQFNKQDLPDALPVPQVAARLGREAAGQGKPAVATRCEGVLETLMIATEAMLGRLVAQAEAAGGGRVDATDLHGQVERAFAPYRKRAEAAPHSAPPVSALVLGGNDLLHDAVQSGVELGDKTATVSARVRRLERESCALRAIGDRLRICGSGFDSDALVDRALAAVADILGAQVVSLVECPPKDPAGTQRVHGASAEPLLDSAEGRDRLERLLAGGPSGIQDDPGLEGLRSLAWVTVDADAKRTMLAYTTAPGGGFDPGDLRFLDAVAAQLAVGLEKAKLYGELALAHE